MPPSLALGLWILALLALLRLDPARMKGTSFALWLPMVSFFIANSRLPSQWLGLVNVGTGYAQAMEEGNSLDRSIYLLLIAMSAAILAKRSFGWARFGRRNAVLVAVLLFALVSVTWSDYVFVAFKRWFRDLAQYLTLLVLLTDLRPIDAFQTVYRRSCYILVSLSVVLIKYFPHIGRQYDSWSGMPMYVGATTSKNVLGALCLVSIIFFAWDTLERWQNRREPLTRRVLWVNGAFLAMSLWLLDKSSSATSTLSVLLATVVLCVARVSLFRRRPRLLLTAVPATFILYAALSFGLEVDLNAWVAGLAGRDPTLTGRTIIWEILLTFVTNPWVGAGYETFWMGPRLQPIWERAGTINQAHNGYLQVYLNLGLVGVGLTVSLLIVTYRNIARQFIGGTSLGNLGLAVWMVLLFFNLSEAAFLTGALWVLVLTTSLSVWQPDAAQAAALEPRVLRRRPVIHTAVGTTPAPTAFVAGNSRVRVLSGADEPLKPRFHTRRHTR